MKSTWFVSIAAVAVAVAALVGVFMLRYVPAGRAGTFGIFVVDRLTGEVCLHAFGQEDISVCVARGSTPNAR